MRVRYPLPVRPITSLDCTSSQARMQRSQRMQAWWSTRDDVRGVVGGTAVAAGQRGLPSRRLRRASAEERVVAASGLAWPGCGVGWSLISSSVSMRAVAVDLLGAVRTFMPGSHGRTQAAASTRAPDVDHAHAADADRAQPRSWQSTGISIAVCSRRLPDGGPLGHGDGTAVDGQAHLAHA